MIGARYEYFTPYTEKYGRIANLDIAPGFTAVAVVTPGQSGPYSGRFPDALVNSDKNNVSPVFGFAWRPTNKGRLLLRGGDRTFFIGSTQRPFPPPPAPPTPLASTPTPPTPTPPPPPPPKRFPP